MFALLLGFVLAACASMGPKDTEQYIFLDRTPVLYVTLRISENSNYEMDVPNISENMTDLRRNDVRSVLQELFQLYDFPILVYFLDEQQEPGPGAVLDIAVLRFGYDLSGDLVATISAKLSRYNELNTLGTYHERIVSPAGINRQQTDDAYLGVIRKPLQEMMDELFLHFRSPDETKSVNEPLSEIGDG